MIIRLTQALADVINVEEKELHLISEKVKDCTYELMYYLNLRGYPELYKVTYRLCSHQMIIDTFVIKQSSRIDYWIGEE